MSAYTRYFRVTSGPLMDKARELEAARQEAAEVMLAFCKEIGADNVMSYRDGRIAGFIFKATPDQTEWKQPNRFGHYYPRKNTAAGREMLERINALPQCLSIETALKEVGLCPPGWPVITEGNTWRGVTLTGRPSLGVLFVGVPWRDIDPKEMAAYKLDRDAGTRLSMTLDHLCWEPTADMVEVKRWQVEKEIEELNAAIRAKNEGVPA